MVGAAFVFWNLRGAARKKWTTPETVDTSKSKLDFGGFIHEQPSIFARPEFKDEAVRQVTERGYSVKEVSERLGVSTHSLYKWVRSVRPTKNEQQTDELLETKRENLKLRAELRRTQEERDILKSRRVLCQGTRVSYAFINAHRHDAALRPCVGFYGSLEAAFMHGCINRFRMQRWTASDYLSRFALHTRPVAVFMGQSACWLACAKLARPAVGTEWCD